MTRFWVLLPAVALSVACDQDGVLKNCDTTEGTICPWAGYGANGFNGDGLDRFETSFSFPMTVTFSEYGDPVVADWNNHKIRRFDPETETFETIMGTDFLGDGDPDKLDITDTDGDGEPEGAPGTTVALNHPTQHQYFEDGTLLSASWHTHKLRTWDPSTDLVQVYLGSTPGLETVEGGTPDQPHDADNCKMNQPVAIEITPDQDVFIVDMRNERIRLLETDTWTISTVAGNGTKGYCGEGPAATTCFNFPKNANPEPGGSIAYDVGRDRLYVADTENHSIRTIDLATGTTSLLAGFPGVPGETPVPAEAGDVDGIGADARFDLPTRIVFDADTGTLFVADANNNKIRAIDVETGEVTTFAGTGEPTCEEEGLPISFPLVCEDQILSGDGAAAEDAKLYRPFGVDLDLDGNVVIADSYNHRFRVVYR